MKKVGSKFRLFKWCLALAVWLAPVVARATVDLDFYAETDQWERNGVYELSVLLTNNRDTDIQIAAVQADYNFERILFKEDPVLLQDNITGYTFAVNVVRAHPEVEGRMEYIKGISSASVPNHFTIPAFSTFTAVTYRVRVAHAAALGETDFEFHITRSVMERVGVEAVPAMGSADSLTITIIEDTTPPDTYASPAGKTLKSGDSLNVRLFQVEDPPYEDLDIVYFEVGEPPVPDPTTASDSVPAGGQVTLPTNAGRVPPHPEPITGVLKFFGRDNWGNLEPAFNTETYIIDMVPPTISNQTAYPARVKLGGTVTVEFEVDEPLGPDPTVRVDTKYFDMVSGPSPYRYTYNVQTGDLEGNRTIRIRAEDVAGNVTTDTSLRVIIDMTPPTFIPVSFEPPQALPAQTLTIKFRASEALDTDLTEVSIDGNPATFVSVGAPGFTYTYEYVVQGTEETSFVKVHGFDLAGNSAWNYEGWGDIKVSGKDVFLNIGVGTGAVGINLKRESY